MADVFTAADAGSNTMVLAAPGDFTLPASEAANPRLTASGLIKAKSASGGWRREDGVLG